MARGSAGFGESPNGESEYRSTKSETNKNI
jgi:hypothetical protein